MSKTATKKTKKPDPKAAGERALNQRKIAMEEEALRIRRIVSKMLEPVQERLTALESRSAPAEDWVPKVGDWVVVTGPAGVMGTDTFRGRVGRIKAFETVHSVSAWYIPEVDAWFDIANIRPATPAEIASHKAKEEQRAKEAEWAKFTELGQFHWTRATKSLIAAADAMGAEWHDSDRMENHLGAVTEENGKLLAQYTSNCAPKDELPEDVFLRLFKGTIAKLREDERAKELAKPLEFGTRVKWDTWTGRVACEGPDHENQYLVAYKPGNGSVWHSTWVRRRDLTIID